MVYVPPIGAKFLYTYKTLAPFIFHIERWTSFFFFFGKTPIVKSLCLINAFIIWNTLQYLHFIFKTNIISCNTCIIFILFKNLVSTNDIWELGCKYC